MRDSQHGEGIAFPYHLRGGRLQPEHVGPYTGDDWEACYLLVDHGATRDVEIIEDGFVCKGVAANFGPDNSAKRGRALTPSFTILSRLL